ncbi:LysR family transcriptional regulator [Intrasporangium mesophilum]
MKSDLADQLLLLALIEEHGTLSAAGEVLGLTPPAVSQRLGRAEAEWGARLVDRGPRGARLTPAGAALAGHGRRIEREVADALATFPAYRQGLVRRLRVGAFQAAALHLLPPAMTALRHQVSDVDLSVIDIQSSDAVDLVARGELDLAVLASWDAAPDPGPDLVLQTILEDPMVVAFADDHPLASKTGPVSFAALADESWVVIRGGTAARQQFDRITREAGFEPRIRFETESYDVAQALVATGYGVALVSRMALRHDPGLTHRPLRHRNAHRTIHSLTPTAARAAPLASAFQELLVAAASDLD